MTHIGTLPASTAGAAQHRARRRGTGLRRAAVLVVLTVSLIVGAAVPSWAAFTSGQSLPTMTIGTATVAPPGTVTASTSCSYTTATVTLTWTPSTSARVSGYRVRVYLNQAYQDQTPLSATTTTWQGGTSVTNTTAYTMTFTVWTLTDYGWTAESAHTTRIVC